MKYMVFELSCDKLCRIASFESLDDAICFCRFKNNDYMARLNIAPFGVYSFDPDFESDYHAIKDL